MKASLLRQKKKLKVKAPTREQWGQFLKEDYARKKKEEEEEKERNKVVPMLLESWEVQSPERERELLGTAQGEYIPKSITTKHVIYSSEWG